MSAKNKSVGGGSGKLWLIPRYSLEGFMTPEKKVAMVEYILGRVQEFCSGRLKNYHSFYFEDFFSMLDSSLYNHFFLKKPFDFLHFPTSLCFPPPKKHHFCHRLGSREQVFILAAEKIFQASGKGRGFLGTSSLFWCITGS